MNKNSGTSSGVGTVGVIGIVFIILKLTGNVTWSWLWVLSPYWMSLGVFVAFVAIFFVVFGTARLLRFMFTTRRDPNCIARRW